MPYILGDRTMRDAAGCLTRLRCDSVIFRLPGIGSVAFANVHRLAPPITPEQLRDQQVVVVRKQALSGSKTDRSETLI